MDEKTYYCDACGFSLSATEVKDATEEFEKGPGALEHERGTGVNAPLHSDALELFLGDVRCEECKDLDRGEMIKPKVEGA